MNNLLGTLDILRTFNMKPNYSELSRLYGKARSTIKRYYENGGKTVITRKRDSGFDFCKDEIKELFKAKGANKKGVYEYLKDKYPTLPSYSIFRNYTSINDIKIEKTTTPHVRYETKPSEQIQIDWKESLKMTSIDKEVFDFNIMTTTLGFSRYHKFTYTRTKTTEDFIRCVIETANHLGGLIEHILTDNMSAVVSITNGSKNKHPKIKQFERDLGIKIKLCKTRSPKTKGKVESPMRILDEIQAYSGTLTYVELNDKIQEINNRVNSSINRGTGKIPINEFEKEKDSLHPLPNENIRNLYKIKTIKTKVNISSMITYNNCQYFVPPEYVRKDVSYQVYDSKIYIYCSTKLISMYNVSMMKLNYDTKK